MRAVSFVAAVALMCAAAAPADAGGWAWFVKNTRSGSYCNGQPTTYYGGGGHNADGSAFNSHGFSAATYDYPFGTVLLVTNCANGRSVTVTVKDRGPAAYQRSLGIRLDLSYGAARAIALGQNGRFESGWTSTSVVSLGSGGETRTASRRQHRKPARFIAKAEPTTNDFSAH